ncbi:MAG: M56 family metallopeptidase [Planctomycetota bacterium]
MEALANDPEAPWNGTIVWLESDAAEETDAADGTLDLALDSAPPVGTAHLEVAAPNRWVQAWMIGSALGTLLLLLAWRRIVARRLQRQELDEGPAFALLQELCAAARCRMPRLSMSPRLVSPATLGILRPEICLPERVHSGLDRGALRAMLGHELAHIRRHDPQWFLLYRLIERVLFFQPLNGWVRREIQELAEYQCDDWAVSQSGNGVDLARCLTEVAGWLHPERPQVALLPMAGRGSRLGYRVRRLLEQGPRPQGRAAGLPCVGCALLVTTALLPGFAGAQPAPDRAEPQLGFDRIPDFNGSEPVEPAIEPASTTAIEAPAAQDLDLGQLMLLLQSQLLQLEDQVHELRHAIEHAPAPEAFEQPLTELENRLDSLREKRARLLSLLAPSNPNTPSHQ